MSRILLTLLAAASLLLLSATTAPAALYGDFAGTSVSFEQVQDQNGLFGNGSPNGGIVASGDALDFSPNAFEAECVGGSAACPSNVVTVEDTLTLFIRADQGAFIDEVRFDEAGDTTLENPFGGRARTTVSAAIFIDILELDGGSANGGQDVSLNVDPATMSFDQGGIFDTANGDNGTLTWTGTLAILLQPTLDAAGFTNGEKATLVQVNLNNILSARIQSPSDNPSARIEKKDGGITITAIPEPGTGLLMGLGLLALTSLRPSRSTEVR